MSLISLIEESFFKAVEATLAAIAPATTVVLVFAAAPAVVRCSIAAGELAARGIDAAHFPGWIKGIEYLHRQWAVFKHWESALASCTLTALVALVLATAPASILAIALLMKASRSGDTTVGPSLGVCADALRVVAGLGWRGPRQIRSGLVVSHVGIKVRIP